MITYTVSVRSPRPIGRHFVPAERDECGTFATEDEAMRLFHTLRPSLEHGQHIEVAANLPPGTLSHKQVRALGTASA